MRSRVSGSAWWLAAALALLTPLGGAAKTYTYKVKHLHAVGSCQGRLIVGESDVRFDSDDRADSRIWTYGQIKKVERHEGRKLTLYTYEDQRLQLGRDKPYDFEFMDGNVSDELFSFIVTRLGRVQEPEPPTTPPGGRFELAAKHTHTFGGCEGTLKINDAYIEFVTSNTKDARVWKYLDIKRVDRRSAYSLDIYTYEDQTLQLGRDKVFHFELKEPLEPAVYEFIRRRLHH